MSFCQVCGTGLTQGVAACPACGAVQGVAVPGPMPGTPPAAPMYAAPVAAGAGLTPNVAGALAYLLGIITGIVFLVIDPFKTDRFVRFHAFQSIFLNLAWIAFWIVWGILGLTLSAISHGLFFIVQVPVNLVLSLGGFCLWLYLMYSAYQGKTVQLPIIGPMAAAQAGLALPTSQRL